jgi:transcriptional regulator with XRE-family HTH domain
MRTTVKRREALADFLKTRRARVRPEQFDLPPFPKRRTLGLRREEVAHLVGVGVSWYTWLEQGRDIQVSDHVLERLARILQLNAEERTHLFVLARGLVQQLDLQEQEMPLQNAAYQAILDAFGICPAYLIDRRLNVIAWNESASRVIGDFAGLSLRERNLVWLVFMHPALRERLPSWEQTARRSVAFLRGRYDSSPEDEWLTELIADFRQASQEFCAWWSEHEILLASNFLCESHHPLVGLLALQSSTLVMPARPDLQTIVYTPLPKADTMAKLKTLMAGRN